MLEKSNIRDVDGLINLELLFILIAFCKFVLFYFLEIWLNYAFKLKLRFQVYTKGYIYFMEFSLYNFHQFLNLKFNKIFISFLKI